MEARLRSFTITIAPDDQTQATTTLRVEVTGAAARITELLVRAGDGDGISAGHFPTVDLEQLVRAIVPATTPAAVLTETAPPAVEPVAEAETPPAPTAATPPAPQVTTQPDVEPAETPQASVKAAQTSRATKTRSRRTVATPTKATASADTPSEPAGTSRRVPTARAAKPATTKKAAAVKSSDGGRTYRRAPEDLEQVFRQAGTAAAIADHYGVPKHTAHNWVRKLRSRDTVTAAG
jgi:outer membrane biosynthesis protein TonB